jgi:broad specificity phosphatase PhoE
MVGVQDPRPSAIAADDALVITIVLARHGRPAWDFRTPIPGHALAEWLRGEGEAPLDPSSRPSAELERLSREAKCLVASPLRRSRDSAQLLAPTADPLIDPCFREAELPSAIRSGLRLRPEIWGWLARTAWFCGWSAGVESFRQARERASHAAALLTGRAEACGAVLLVGHGLMNIMIAQRLRASGWRGPRFPSRKHWTFGVYERAAA